MTSFFSRIVGWACKLGIKGCTDKAEGKWREWMEEKDPDREGANP